MTDERRSIELLEHDPEHPMTVRQLFYRRVSAGTITNGLRDYQRVSRLITKARRDETRQSRRDRINSEAPNVTGLQQEFAKRNTKIIGMSVDPVTNHGKFPQGWKT